MPRTRTEATTPSPAMTPATIPKLVADSVAAALKTQAATMAQSSSINSSKEESEAVAPRKCTYKDFMSCKPTNFKGIKGVTELAQWFEHTETVFMRSGCPDNCKVTYAKGTLIPCHGGMLLSKVWVLRKPIKLLGPNSSRKC